MPISMTAPSPGVGVTYDHEHNLPLQIDNPVQDSVFQEPDSKLRKDDNDIEQESDIEGPSFLSEEQPDSHENEYEEEEDRVETSAIEEIVPPQCPQLFLTTKTSFDTPMHTSSSTSASYSPALALRPDQVTCRPVSSQLQGYFLAFCISNTDCSAGFIQVVRRVPPNDLVFNLRVSKNLDHDRFFHQVAGPDDFYFLLAGAQKLALAAHLVPTKLLVDVNGLLLNSVASEVDLAHEYLVYRADFRMTLPGPVQLSSWLTYERFGSIRENHPGVWPQWTHAALVGPNTVVDSINDNSSDQTVFSICPQCDFSPFVEKLRAYREEHFAQCDRKAPARGSYWREDLALKIYSELDVVNTAPGAGVDFKEDSGKRTKGWRFVPNGCTMTKTPTQPNAASQDPYVPMCDSVASPSSAMRAPPSFNNSQGDNDDAHNKIYPRRRILFTGDSQVRTTYNAIMNHYRPLDSEHQSFSAHDEFLPNQDTLAFNKTSIEHNAKLVIPHKESDTDIEMLYKADQYLETLIASSDIELDQYDTIYLNLGQWPASGPAAGGQWSTAQLIERWRAVVMRLDRWKASREVQLQSRCTSSDEAWMKNPAYGTGDSSIVIWAGMNAFPMRTDIQIKLKGDWRTNARLGYWDDWIETISQETGGWFRRINAWQLTFPMIDEIVDRAHFQQTDAIDALKIEALYKLDLCSRMQPDTPY
ncbi:hypothetical protein BGZ99_009454 [Dissophora globulifera]|uniref:Uncharacterized protein n=1 Tax=Dissophora globulifera TaxID=979702 RepID=A0A9P6UNB3_9FUNG|nr:hypothetical protein BGZ99_009454 [Dissophora globulifera]